MTKKELIEMLSEVPDDAMIKIVESKQDLLYGNSCYQIDIKGFYERNGSYILSGLNVRPYKIEKHD